MNFKQTVFISAFNSELTDSENLQRHSELQDKLDSLGYVFYECLGCYDGKQELSICVDIKNSDNRVVTNDIFQLLGYAKKYNQQCIMYINNDNSAALLFDEDNQENIGTFTEISSLEDLIGVSGYSFINDKFYIVK